MTTRTADGGLWAALDAYLVQRRALGYQLVEEERHARRLLDWLPASADMSTGFTVAQALRWAHGDGSSKDSYQRQRLSAIRGLARYCHAIGLEVQVPPAHALRTTRYRRRPHIYSQDEVDALIGACQHTFTHPLVRATMAAIIALLAVTGMRRGSPTTPHRRPQRPGRDPADPGQQTRPRPAHPDPPHHPRRPGRLRDEPTPPSRGATARGAPVRHHPRPGLPARDRGGPLPTHP